MKKILGALALASGSCAFLEHRKTAPIMAEDKQLVVNIDSQKHYYVEASKEEGIKQLRQLAATSILEEAFFHVQVGR